MLLLRRILPPAPRAPWRTGFLAAPLLVRGVQRCGFAAEAAPERRVRPPATVFGLDGTYATALYTASEQSNSLDAVSKAMRSLRDWLAQDAKRAAELASPGFKAAQKAKVVEMLQKAAGPAGSQPVLTNFLRALSENNRFRLLGAICSKFDVLVMAGQGEVEMVVTSAEALDSKVVSRLRSAVEKSGHLEPGQKLKPVNKVDPSILGGLIVRIGDKTIDVSVASRVNKYNKLLRTPL